MAKDSDKRLIKRYDLDVGSFYFYENFVIAEMKEGVFLDFEKSNVFFELGKNFYGDKTPFVYISNRVNSYSIDPVGHFKCVSLFPNLVGYAVVVHGEMNLKVAELEQSFIKNKRAKIFKDLDGSIAWVDKLIVTD